MLETILSPASASVDEDRGISGELGGGTAKLPNLVWSNRSAIMALVKGVMSVFKTYAFFPIIRCQHGCPPDLEPLSHIEKMPYTAVLSDALDNLGIRDRTMRGYLRPLAPDVVFAGRAKTILRMDMHHMPDILTHWK
jgi:hypothetical protein